MAHAEGTAARMIEVALNKFILTTPTTESSN